MPSIKARQPAEPGTQSPVGLPLPGSRTTQLNSGQSLKQSKKRSKKNRKKAKTKRQKKMNLPSRLSRILNYGTKKAQKTLAKSKATTEYQGSGVTGARINDALSLNDGVGNGCLSASSIYSQFTSNTFHLRTFERGFVSSQGGNDKQDLNGNNNKLDAEKTESNEVRRLIPKEKLIALDCEMVGVGPGGRISALARCSIVDYDCNVLYDAYIKPELEIHSYRTPWSGIRKHHMDDAIPFTEAQQLIASMLKGKILIGHSLRFDLCVLKLGHPQNDIRDTSMYRGLRELSGMTFSAGQHPGLKKLTKVLFGHSIQTGEHCSVEDAKATMNLYKLVEKQWEEERMATFSDRDFKLSFMDDHFWPDDLGH